MKTKQTETEKQFSQHLASIESRIDQWSQHLARIESRVDKQSNRLDAITPIKGQVHGTSLEVDLETKRQMAIEAQNLGLRSADELTQIVLHAFIELCKEENFITFPLMLQQVPTA
jgi:hypothetical protein